ncbi:MAG: competence/damage-inducible protein A [Firmicutes bacterium]|nr:competence/damage-inducible protein A [Bacillota bacterium]
MKAEIIATGTELLLGQITNTNARFLSEKLAEKGIDVYWHTVVGDNPARVEAALRTALDRADIIITSGGLGPTMDDLTKETLAKVLALPLEMDTAWQKQMEKMFSRPGAKMTSNNLKQALVPKGGELLPNAYGTAPGVWLEHQGKIIVMLPGPPRELEPMFMEEVLPRLPKTGSILLSRVLKITGIGEAATEDAISDLVQNQTNPTIAPLAKLNEVHLRLTAKGKNKEECLQLLDELDRKLQARLGNSIFARDEETMVDVVAKLLFAQKRTVAVAESCTGGLLAHILTNIPGSSDYFHLGLVTYSNQAKVSQLHIAEALLAAEGAVSESVAKAMANNVRQIAHTDFGIGITGIAGPTGGTEEKPVGLVYIALATPSQVKCHKFNFLGTRENIKERAVISALNMLRLYLLEHNLG